MSTSAEVTTAALRRAWAYALLQGYTLERVSGDKYSPLTIQETRLLAYDCSEKFVSVSAVLCTELSVLNPTLWLKENAENPVFLAVFDGLTCRGCYEGSSLPLAIHVDSISEFVYRFRKRELRNARWKSDQAAHD